MSQSLSKILLHVIFSTKARKMIIQESIQQELYAIIISIASKQGSYVYKIGGVEDHLHILLTLPRTLSVAELIEEIKKQSSKWIKTKDTLYKDFNWQSGYGVFSVSESQGIVVSNYIGNQKEHHKNFSFQEEFKKFLDLYKTPYNEKYLWD